MIGWVVASESCCFQSIGAKLCHEVRPGNDRVSSRQNAHVSITTIGALFVNCEAENLLSME